MPGAKLLKTTAVESRIKSFEGRMKTARSMERRARYGKRLKALKARLAYLKIQET